MADINDKKQKIISFLNISGPSLPVRIAKVIEMEPIFASAILSELYNEEKVKMSNLRVGASPLFYVKGHEEKLQNFIENLKPVEKEAFHKIKKEKILLDEEQEPAIRVALKSIKDFAIPFQKEGKEYWKFAFATEEEINPTISPKKIQEPIPTEIKKVETKENKEKVETQKEEKVEENKIEILQEVKSEFLDEVKNFLKKNETEITQEIQIDKKEVIAKIKIKSKISELDYLLIAKNKKSVNKEEINIAMQRASYHKMPCLLLLRKKPAKGVQNLLKETGFITSRAIED